MQLGRDRVRERRCRGIALRPQLEQERMHAGLRRSNRGSGGCGRVDAPVERRELFARGRRPLEQLLVARGAEAPLRLRDPVEARLELLEPSRLGLQRREKRAEVGRGLAQAQLDVAQLVAGALELGSEPLEGRHRPLCERDEAGGAVAVLGRERVRRRRSRFRELGDVPEPLPVGAEPLLLAVLHPVRVLCECAQLRQPGLGERGVRGQLLVTLPRALQLAPRDAHRLALGAGEAVEQLELVRGPRKPALLELPRHRDHALDGCRDVLARRRAAPCVRARAPVGEHTARDEERVLVLGAQVGELVQLVRQVELRLDVRLLGPRPDEGRFPLRPEQEPDRLREDRLPGAGLAGDRVQAGRELELGLADEDEVLDAQAAEHGTESREGLRRRLLPFPGRPAYARCT